VAGLGVPEAGTLVRHGPDGDFDSVFAAEYRAVVRTVYLVCHDLPYAHDITQEAFVELLQHWHTVSRYERPGAWVRRVAIRKVLKALRRDERRRLAESSVSPHPGLEPVDVDVVAAIQALPVRQRTAVVLYYYEDLPRQEVAELLGCSASTAAAHVHRARLRLSQVLREEVRADEH
jgi:RNA polymerase sigma-70 factor (ECF subfamily)